MAPGHGSGNGEGACPDAVSDHPVGTALERCHPGDRDRRCAMAADLRPHGIEAICQIDDFRFPGSVVDHRLTCGECRRHQRILGRPDTDHRKVIEAPFRPFGAAALM